MKLYNPLVVLALVTSTFANTIPVKRQTQAQPQAQQQAQQQAQPQAQAQMQTGFTQACQIELKKYEECYYLFNSLNMNKPVDDVCGTFYSDKCQQFYKNGIKSLEGCKNDNVNLVTYNQGRVDLEAGTITAICGRDENGNTCPVQSLIIQLNKKLITQDEYLDKLEDAIKETCKSPQCTDIYLKYNLAEAKAEIDNSMNQAYSNFLNEVKANISNQGTKQIPTTVQNPVNTTPNQNQNTPGQNQNTQGQNQNTQGQNQNTSVPNQTTTFPPKVPVLTSTAVTTPTTLPSKTTIDNPIKNPIEIPIENPVERPKPMMKRQAQITDEIYEKASEFVRNSGAYLRSEECKAQASGASTLKATSALIASIGLFLYTLL